MRSNVHILLTYTTKKNINPTSTESRPSGVPAGSDSDRVVFGEVVNV